MQRARRHCRSVRRHPGALRSARAGRAIPDLPHANGDHPSPHGEVHRLQDRPGAGVEFSAAGPAAAGHPAVPGGALGASACAAGAGGSVGPADKFDPRSCSLTVRELLQSWGSALQRRSSGMSDFNPCPLRRREPQLQPQLSARLASGRLQHRADRHCRRSQRIGRLIEFELLQPRASGRSRDLLCVQRHAPFGIPAKSEVCKVNPSSLRIDLATANPKKDWFQLPRQSHSADGVKAMRFRLS